MAPPATSVARRACGLQRVPPGSAPSTRHHADRSPHVSLPGVRRGEIRKRPNLSGAVLAIGKDPFVEAVQQVTDGNGVSIFVDNIGTPVFRATLRAFGRLGIVTTSGWKHGKKLSYDRTAATVGRHIFLHVHGCRRIEGVRGIEFAEHGWLSPAGAEVYAWDDIPQLAADYASGKVESYTPVFEVNGL